MIRVGITEMHGIAQEICAYPPESVIYSEIYSRKHFSNHIISSPAKGVLHFFEGNDVDIIEAPLFPVLTNKKWLYTPADFPTCISFGAFGYPLPRCLRIKFIRSLFLKDNFIKLLFKSYAGKETLHKYLGKTNDDLFKKVDVVYPAVRKVNDSQIKFNTNRVNILFVGDFLGKGGVHVVEAFEELQKEFSNIKLTVCASEKFKTNNAALEKKYLDKLRNNNAITFGFVDRNYIMNTLLPDTDIFVCPTYKDSYGYAIEEAMAYGIPVISTNHFAIPEIVEHERSGFLINTSQFDFINEFKSYYVDHIPNDFLQHMNNEVYKYLRLLVSNFNLRKTMGLNGLAIARSKFSFDRRNEIMKKIYIEALSAD